MTGNAIVGTWHFPLERWSRCYCAIVTEIAVHVIGNFIGKFRRRWLIGILNGWQWTAVVSCLQMTGATTFDWLRVSRFEYCGG